MNCGLLLLMFPMIACWLKPMHLICRLFPCEISNGMSLRMLFIHWPALLASRGVMCRKWPISPQPIHKAPVLQDEGRGMKITMLGCGTSVGVPALGKAGWGTCDPDNPKNRRTRCAILVQKDGFNLLVDAGPDIRNQLIAAGNPKIHAVLITHTHSDHVAGNG